MNTPLPTPPMSEHAQAPSPAWFSKVSHDIEQMPVTFWKHLALYFFGAILLGFLVKRSIVYVLFASIIAGLVLWFLHSIGAAQFDFSQIRAHFGISPNATLEQFITDFLAWARAHVSLVVAALVGFIIGLQID